MAVLKAKCGLVAASNYGGRVYKRRSVIVRRCICMGDVFDGRDL